MEPPSDYYYNNNQRKLSLSLAQVLVVVLFERIDGRTRYRYMEPVHFIVFHAWWSLRERENSDCYILYSYSSRVPVVGFVERRDNTSSIVELLE